MLNRYLRFVRHQESVTQARAAVDMNMSSARHSMVHRARVIWPKLTPKNMQSMSGPSPYRSVKVACMMRDRLFPLLGEAECFAQIGAGGTHTVAEADIEIRVIKRKIQVGNCTYDYKLREANRRKGGGSTCSSWFRIRTGNVPNYVHNPTLEPVGLRALEHKCEVELIAYTIDPFLYGRVTRFLQVKVANWNNGEPFQLAQVELFRSHQAAAHTNLRHINTKDPVLRRHHSSTDLLPIEFVHVRDLDSHVAVAPFGRQPPKDVDLKDVDKKPAEWKYVLPIEHDDRDLEAIGDPEPGAFDTIARESI